MAGSNYTVINAASIAAGSSSLTTPVNQAVVHQLCSIDVQVTNNGTKNLIDGARIDLYYVCTANTYNASQINQSLSCFKKVECLLSGMRPGQVKTFKSGPFIVDGTSVWSFWSATGRRVCG